MAEIFYNSVGFIGAFLLLFGFYRTSIGKWRHKSFWYELDNLFGAIFVAVYQIHKQAYISVVVNIIWATVAFTGLTSFAERYLANGRRKKRRK